MTFEIVPPEPDAPSSVPLPSVSDMLENIPSANELMDSVWAAMLDAIEPLFVPVTVGFGSAIIVMFLLKRFLARRAQKYMLGVYENPVPGALRWFFGSAGRIDERMEFSIRGTWASFRRPRSHAACWYIAGNNKEMFEELLAVSRDGEKFGTRLPFIAEKAEKTWGEDPVVMWRRVMEWADKPEAHDRLAAPGYTIEQSLIAVEQDIPLEYASALA